MEDDDYDSGIVVVYGAFCFVVFLMGIIGLIVQGWTGAIACAIVSALGFAFGCGLYAAYYKYLK